MAEAAASSRSRDSISNTLLVAIGMSLVCSLLVAGAAVLLKPQQLRNEALYRQNIILDVAGLARTGVDPATARRVNVTGTRINDDGMSALKKLIPKVKIRYNNKTIE